MEFSNITQGSGLIQECERITGLGAGGISGVSQLLKDFTSRLNAGVDRFFALAQVYDSNWNMDDRRYADDDAKLPIGLVNLVSGTGDYLLDIDLLATNGQVFCKDPNGNYKQLEEQDDKTDPQSYLQTQPNGTPTHFKFVGNSIILTPTPNYSVANGIKIPYKRTGKKFATDSAGVVPGIPVLFHMYLARYASYPYCAEKGLKNAGAVLKQIGSADREDPLYGGDEAMIALFVSNRSRPKSSGLRAGAQSNK